MIKYRTIRNDEPEFKKLVAVAKLLEAFSPNNAKYEVSDVYFDYGLNWMWTTICRREYRECQVLCPRDWEMIMIAQTPADLIYVVDLIRNDKYFGDK